MDYDNGPINGTNDAWTINFGYVVSDTFISGGSSAIGFAFGVWEFSGDTMTSVEWSITSGENSGTVYGSGTASGGNLTDKFISTNQYGYNIDVLSASSLGLPACPEGPNFGSTCRMRSSPAATRCTGMKTAAPAAAAPVAERTARLRPPRAR